MKYILPVLCLFITIWACKPEEEKFTYDSSAALRFSADTVLFDTIFTSVGSITKRFKVYNDNKNALNIESITLADNASPYTIYVNGRAASSFSDTRILGEDSLLVLVEVRIDPNDQDLPFIVADEIVFNTNGNRQDVKLVSWGQDANFIHGTLKLCDEVWTANRPYVIYNSIIVESSCNLTIEPGAKIYSHNSSYILVEGSITAEGTAEERISFTNDRLDYENVPGQWGGIVFLEGSKNNSITYADIRNAEVGIYLGTPDDDDIADLVIGNCTIENIGGLAENPITGGLVAPGYGVLAITSDLYMYNTLINNCAVNVLGNYAGGNYIYEHCTFANYSFDFFREDPAVVFSNNLQLLADSLLVADLNIELYNNIIWGSIRDEIILSSESSKKFELAMSNNIIRTNLEQLNTNNNIINQDPHFVNPSNYNYHLDTLSIAKDAGIDINLSTDHDGNTRDAKPDIGAFERIEN
ncbi:right-handed parallel beta-helix repeat-containing protein [Fulvivirga sediminis]|uniref:Right-handed parallel beta-helix repeat-containing protein n=1 Tax=Fulvivirga sediminis TaxID=2803949 RepID=A0A937F437_9BACT|nr:right-handed parallel beta-helix repeat-containing protein [Fulvivirga sediminis]MBL3654646.1 right-handed parallel beta-helix repeat-containing protein [Fulvivirga sediminis]